MHEEGEGVDAFVTFGPGRDDDVPSTAGEVYGLYVHPHTWGRGIGTSILTAAVAALRSEESANRAITTRATERLPTSAEPTEAPLVLWTLEGNRRARGFYERQGWRVDGARRQQQRPGVGEVPGITFTEVRYLLFPRG